MKYTDTEAEELAEVLANGPYIAYERHPILGQFFTAFLMPALYSVPALLLTVAAAFLGAEGDALVIVFCAGLITVALVMLASSVENSAMAIVRSVGFIHHALSVNARVALKRNTSMNANV